jgi:hypothetical protein
VFSCLFFNILLSSLVLQSRLVLWTRDRRIVGLWWCALSWLVVSAFWPCFFPVRGPGLEFGFGLGCVLGLFVLILVLVFSCFVSLVFSLHCLDSCAALSLRCLSMLRFRFAVRAFRARTGGVSIDCPVKSLRTC